MAKMNVLGTEITVVRINDDDYISLTDMVHNIENGEFFIHNWLRNRNTVEFLGIWEKVYNPNFNPVEFDRIKSQSGLNSYRISVKERCEKTKAIGIQSRAGRYGGTFAHKDIANDGVPQEKRIVALNKTAISQMKILTAEYGIKKLESKPIKK